MSFGIRRFILVILSYLKYLYYFLPDNSVKARPSDSAAKSLLLIKVDEIGDYILFRNFLKYVKQSPVFKDYKITLCGNTVWKSIFEYMDKDNVDSSIWIDKKQFLKSLNYRKTFLSSVAQNSYDTVINCSLSRNFFVDDSIVRTINAINKLGSKTDLSSQFNWQRKISDGYYSRLITVSNEYVFDFLRNKDFISSILKTSTPEVIPLIEKRDNKPADLPEKYAVFFLGGRTDYKIWNTHNFVAVARYIKEKYNFKIVLLGGGEDTKFSVEFENNFDKDYVKNYTAKTSLVDAVTIINSAEIMVSNDSGLAHMAAALQKKIIVLANGTHFGRFFPYPPEAVNVKVIYPPEIEDNRNNFSELAKNYKYRSTLDINSILPEKVIADVENFLG